MTRAGGAQHNYLCAGYRTFYERVTPVLRAMGMLISAGYPASDIMKPRVASSLGVSIPCSTAAGETP